MKNVAAQFTTEKDKTGNSPIYLVEITGRGYSTNPAYYIASADDVRVYSSYPSTYIDYDDGHLAQGEGIGDVRFKGQPCCGLGAVSNCTIKIRNEGNFSGFLDTYAEPINLEVRVRLLFDDGTALLDSEAADLFQGVIADWKHDQQTVTIACTDRGLTEMPDLPKTIVTKKQWPHAPASSIGRYLPIVYGEHSHSSPDHDSYHLLPNSTPAVVVDSSGFEYIVADHPCDRISTGGFLELYAAEENAMVLIPTDNLTGSSGWPSRITVDTWKASIFFQPSLYVPARSSGVAAGIGPIVDDSPSTTITINRNETMYLRPSGLSNNLGVLQYDPAAGDFKFYLEITSATGVGGSAALYYYWNGNISSAGDAIAHGDSGFKGIDFGEKLDGAEPKASRSPAAQDWTWEDLCGGNFDVGITVTNDADFDIAINNACFVLLNVPIGGYFVYRELYGNKKITRKTAWGPDTTWPSHFVFRGQTICACIDGFECQAGTEGAGGNLSSDLAVGALVTTPTDILESIARDWWGVPAARLNTTDTDGYKSFPQAATAQANSGTWKATLYISDLTSPHDLVQTIAKNLCLNVWWGAEGKINVSHYGSGATSRHTFAASNIKGSPQVALSPISEIITETRVDYFYDYTRSAYRRACYVNAEKHHSRSLLNGALDSSETDVTVDDADHFYIESGVDGVITGANTLYSGTARFKSAGARAGDLVVIQLGGANETTAVVSVDSEYQVTCTAASLSNADPVTYYVVQQYILVDREIMQITDVEPEVLTVARGACGSTADTHDDNTPVFLLVPGSDDGAGTRDESGDGNREHKAMLSVAKYGKVGTLDISNECCRDDTTAGLVRDHYFDYFYEQKPTIRFSTGLEAAHLEIHDLVTITHGLLPDAASGGKFEILELTHRPSVSDPMAAIEIFARGV